MVQPEQGLRDSVASNNGPVISRRNLPRASHACQWCREKKARCDQQQPCSNCTRYSKNCSYGIRRRNGNKRNNNIQSLDREEISDRPNQFQSPELTWETQDVPAGIKTPENTHGSARSDFASQALPINDSDVLGDINQHTHGTEFYGTSSNFVLLNQLFAYAQKHLPPGHAGYSSRNEISYLSPYNVGGAGLDTALPQGRISIINLLSNEEALSPPSRPKTPLHSTDEQPHSSRDIPYTSSRTTDEIHSDSSQLANNSAPALQNAQARHDSRLPPSPAPVDLRKRVVPFTPVSLAERRLEREYVRLFMSNLHYIHPLLDPIAFAARCEEQIWSVNTPIERKKDLRHFLALYNIVVAVGALVAGSGVNQDFGRDISLCMDQSTQSEDSRQPFSQALSKVYFRKSRVLLGDVFEVCSLESAQTLLLMSLYCQNSLKPHACYMYCGQAVRTALAIGIASESLSSSAEDRKAARRTWWCIYSHEIDMSCSSGRRDSLGKPRNYQIPLVRIRDQNASAADTPEVEHNSVAMVNEMVHFAAILRRISKEIYHDSKSLTLSQKSMVAMELNNLLESWKAQLPRWLDFSQVSFREDEWAAKQKLVLHLRYLNARILVHRPFLAAPVSRGQLQMSRHVELCLDAARDTIRVLHDAYANRHYFRTWWYNSTYTLYAGMIVLYVIMLGHSTVNSTELLNDVVKSRDVLQSMEEATVARRSADLIGEALQVAKLCVQYRQNPASFPAGNRPDQDDDRCPGQLEINDMTAHTEIDFSRTILPYAVPGQDPGPLLASFIDSNLLQDFTAGTNNLPGLDFSIFPFDGSYSDGPESDLASMLQWQHSGTSN